MSGSTLFSTNTSLITSPVDHTEGTKLSANVGFGSVLSLCPSPSVSGFRGSVPSSFSAVSGRPSPSVSTDVFVVDTRVSFMGVVLVTLVALFAQLARRKTDPIEKSTTIE